MAKSSQPWDLNPLIEAFSNSIAGMTRDQNYDEMSLRIKDLDKTMSSLIDFFKAQGLHNKELGDIIKKTIEYEKNQTKSRKGQGISQDTSLLHISQELNRYFALSAQGKSKAFDVNSSNDLIKAMKNNLSTYEKLISAINDLQKTVANLTNSLGGKLGQSMKTGKGGKAQVPGGFQSLLPAPAGQGGTKDTDLKSAAAKGNPFMKGIGTLIGFLGSKSGSGFLGKLSGVLADYAKGVGADLLKLVTYGILSLVRNFGPSALKIVKWLGIGGKILGGGATRALTKGISSAARAAKHAKDIGKIVNAGLKGAKVGAKMGAKVAAKKAPFGVGAAIGLGLAAARWGQGDKLGAVLEALSGIASIFPGIGTAISFVLDGVLAIKDLFNWKKKRDTAIGKTVTDMSKGIEDDNKEKKTFWESYCDWMKDHMGTLIGLLIGGPIGGALGAIVDHFRNQGKNSNVSGGQGSSAIAITGIDGSFDNRKKLAQSYLSQLTSKGVNTDTDYVRERVEKLYGVKIGKVATGSQMNPVIETSYSDTWDEKRVGAKVNSTRLKHSLSDAGIIDPENIGLKATTKNAGQGNVAAVALESLKLHGSISSGNSIPYIAAQNVGRIRLLDNYLHSKGYKFQYTSAMGGGHAGGARSHGAGHKVDIVIDNGPAGYNKMLPEDQRWMVANGYIGNGAIGYHQNSDKKGYHWDLGIGPSNLGSSSGSIPEYSAETAIADATRAASEPKGKAPETAQVAQDMDVEVAEGETLEQTLKNAYADNKFDQTGNTQFLSAINSIRVQLGKYQQIGMVVR